MSDDGVQEQQRNSHLKKYEFKLGESGNPGGRPKGKSITAELRKLIEKGNTAEDLAKVLLGMSTKDLAALRELLDRTDGKVVDKHLNVTVSITPESLQAARERLQLAQADTRALLGRYKGNNATE